MIRLRCSVQQYKWGKLGRSSEVAQLYASMCADPETAIDEETPYAELWMGTHPSGPSYVKGNDGADEATLKSRIESDAASALGEACLARFGADLPFLFKVLSVRTALSIQAHPNKDLARQLHAERPHVYKDPNHKPEMTVALTPFEALCQFRSAAEVRAHITDVPEFAECVGDAETCKRLCAALLLDHPPAEAAAAALREAFANVMTRDAETVSALLLRLIARLEKKGPSRSAAEDLALRLHAQYPGDVGVFASFFLNFVSLAPGESIALEANEPHAYLAGDCVEVMATSDNVVRAGLTPKLRDTGVLCDMLTYKMGPPTVGKGEPVSLSRGGSPATSMRAYVPPFAEFQMNVLAVGAGEAAGVGHLKGPLVVLVHAGACRLAVGGREDAAKKGDVFFAPSGTGLLDVQEEGGAGCTLFVASLNQAACF